ncbi:MAG: tetratricopeptide repeat protein [Planctomycetia bacterium]|nr:tetratricopeptide repeat protein [Planctomycetia bacterium]
MTPWHRNEYILKGLFLGLWVFFALQVPADSKAAWLDIAWVMGWVCTGLAVGYGLGMARLMSRGLKPWQNWRAFPILVLLESPLYIYSGIMIGLAFGVLSGREFAQPWAGPIANLFGLSWEDIKHLQSTALPDDDPQKGKLPGDWLGYCAVAGALAGYGLYRMRQMQDGRMRFLLGIGIAALVVYLASEFISQVPTLETAEARRNLGIYILLGLPFFYLLTFSGEAEESEVEIMTICAAMGVALYLLGLESTIPGVGGAGPFLLPLAIYFVYVTRVLHGLRTFKHILRGFSYMNLERLALAIRFFRRALELQPTSPLANQGMVTLHNNLTLSKLERDPDLVEELDFGLCLDRASALLMVPPTSEAREEADKFLNLVEQKKPAYMARVDYLRVVSFLHAKQYDTASETLGRLLSPETPGYHSVVRKQVLFDAWFLALDGPKKLVESLGWAELNKPGRRMEAIAAVERKLAAEPTHDKAKEYKTMLYSQLTEGEFISVAAAGTPKDFSYEYVEQLGQQLVDDNDPERRERGMAYLRMAGRGLPERAPGIFKKLADVTEKHGDPQTARTYLDQIKRCGEVVGPRNLAKDQRDIYLKTLQKLAGFAESAGDAIKAEADAADAHGDAQIRIAKDAEAKPHFEEAIDNLHLYRNGGGGDLREMYRKVAELYAKMRDPLNGLINVAAAMQYDSNDSDLLKKRDSYYYSLPIERLAAAKENIGSWFDVGYCVRKAMSVLNARDADAELLDWATHLCRLAKVMEPGSNRVRLIEARCLLRRGERDAGLTILEDIRESPKGSGEEEESWYNTTKLLGQLYLDELGRPDLALKAYIDYKEFHKSGADTLFQIAKCYEAMGDTPSAIKFYDAVTAYEEHPRYWDAKEALKRLKGGG